MDAYDRQTQAVLEVNERLLAALSAAKPLPGLGADGFGEWEAILGELPKHLAEGTVRVAVVGPIKSGKSTFLNAFLGGDYLKRGAGVVTSIVTRVRAGSAPEATLVFKSWAEVNADIGQALVLFPAAGRQAFPEDFDIRRSAARSGLRAALEALSSEQRIAEDARNRNMVLLSCYLNGYDTAARFVAETNTTHACTGGQFERHWDFSGNEALAVYLKDILIRVETGRIGRGVEIADCQGSDSSNPLHLAMIQDYLRSAHLLVYVISSRTGLRRADIKFLSIIRKMGILDNILFVLNCDFNEHRSLEELQGLVRRVAQELALVKPQPELFTFSALHQLFVAPGAVLVEKDRRRLELWQSDAELVAYSDREAARFLAVFDELLGRRHSALLLQHPLDRLQVIAGGLAHWSVMSREILSRDAAGAAAVVERMRHYQRRFEQLLDALQSAVSGTVPRIKQELATDVNRLLDGAAGEVSKRIEAFISGYRFEPEAADGGLAAGGFSAAMYRAFQEFKQALDVFLTEQIHPELIRFTAERETRIGAAIAAIAAPYCGMIEDAYQEFCRVMSEIGPAAAGSRLQAPMMPRAESLVGGSGLTQPSLANTMRYSARIRTEAILRREFYRVLTGFKKALKKPVKEGEDQRRALKEGLARIKSETRDSLSFQMKDYQENLKFKYIFKLVELAAARLCVAVAQQVRAYSADFGALAELAGARKRDKARIALRLEEVEQRSREAMECLARLRAGMA